MKKYLLLSGPALFVLACLIPTPVTSLSIGLVKCLLENQDQPNAKAFAKCGVTEATRVLAEEYLSAERQSTAAHVAAASRDASAPLSDASAPSDGGRD